jgi:hypothetical protein
MVSWLQQNVFRPSVLLFCIPGIKGARGVIPDLLNQKSYSGMDSKQKNWLRFGG